MVDLAFGQQQVEDLAPPEVVDGIIPWITKAGQARIVLIRAGPVFVGQLPECAVGEKNAVGDQRMGVRVEMEQLAECLNTSDHAGEGVLVAGQPTVGFNNVPFEK